MFLGDLVLLATADGQLQDSFISIKDSKKSRVSLLTGHSRLTNAKTIVLAETKSPLSTSASGETLELSGGAVLEGIIGHPGAKLQGTKREAVFKIKATPIN